MAGTHNNSNKQKPLSHRFGLTYKLLKGKGNSKGEVHFSVSTNMQKNVVRIKMTEGENGEMRVSDNDALHSVIMAYKSPMEAINNVTKKLSRTKGVVIVGSELVMIADVHNADNDSGKSEILEHCIFKLAETFITCKSILKKYRYPLPDSTGYDKSNSNGNAQASMEDKPAKTRRKRKSIRRK